MIERHQAIAIHSSIDASRRKIIVLYGARQVGKTTLINSILKKFNGKILQINADNTRFEQILSSRDVDILKGFTAGYDILFIDEAQRIPDIGINLKIIHDEIKDIKIVITGSSSLDLATHVREPLTGRTSTYTLYPISINEYKEEFVLNDFEVREKLPEFILYGMYPEVLTIENFEEKKNHLAELASSYLYKDILDLANIKHTQKLRQLLQMLAYQIGHEVSIHELSRTLAIHRDAIIRYLDLLEKSFVIFRLSGFSRNLRKEITKMDKIYFLDLGIRNALIGNFAPIQIRPDKGALWENFLIIEKLKENNIHQRFSNLYFWRTYSGSEIDLIEEYDGRLYGYEMKLGTKKAKAPKSWMDTYPEALFYTVNENTYLNFLENRFFP